jgi:hypothetical protein
VTDAELAAMEDDAMDIAPTDTEAVKGLANNVLTLAGEVRRLCLELAKSEERAQHFKNLYDWVTW